jgi:glycosyltransferase involved in cell wall biosynthesis
MACGTPVVTCKNSSLTEVGGDIAFYVKSEDAQGILDVMENMENETGNRESLILQGIQYASRFTWEKCAKQTIAVYNKYLL